MNYPLISEYIESIKSAEDNFDKLNNLRPVYDVSGNPIMTSGNFAVVFKMKDNQSGKSYAVKCFLKDQPNRTESYKLITEELESVTSPYLTHFKYYDKELFVDTINSTESEFPVLLMDWVDGITLDKYIRQNIGDQFELRMLAYRFSCLAMWLIPQPFAHGDIKPDNIIVRDDGTLVLIDYDGMYVPAMKGQKARELGSPDFRHPSRTENDFNEHIDDFSLTSMLLSLKAIAETPSLLNEYGASDRLLFSENDYRDFSSCQILKDIYPSADTEINTLVGVFTIVLTHKDLSGVSSNILSLSNIEDILQMYTYYHGYDEEKENSFLDSYGVRYKDCELLGVGKNNLKRYSIKNGTTIICESAFAGQEELESINIPNSVLAIGDNAFGSIDEGNDWESYYANNYSLKTIIIPNSVRFLGDLAFKDCTSLKHVTLSNKIKKIGFATFSGCSSLENLKIPKSVTSIGESAFADCESLTTIYISDNVTEIGKNCFHNCINLKSIIVIGKSLDKIIKIIPKELHSKLILNNDGVIKPYNIDLFISMIDTTAKDEDIENSIIDKFGARYSKDGKKLLKVPYFIKEYTIAKGTEIICDEAFYDPASSCIEKIEIPESVSIIGNYAFCNCMYLSRVILHDGLIKIGDKAFSYCSSLGNICIPKTVRTIGINPFFESECKLESLSQQYKIVNDFLFNEESKSLITCLKKSKKIQIPNFIRIIGDCAFENFNTLEQIQLPDDLIKIGNNSFERCYSLKFIILSNKVETIGNHAFSNCASLSQFVIPNSIRKILGNPFVGCSCKLINNSPFFSVKDNILYHKVDKKLISCCNYNENIEIQSDTEIIGPYAFEWCTSIKVIILPECVSRIEDGAFRYCENLTHMDLPNGLRFLGEKVFSGCRNIKKIAIPLNIKQIGKETFTSCSSLNYIYLPSGITSIGDSAFEFCSSLRQLFIPNSTKSLGRCALRCCGNLEYVHISPNIHLINDLTFDECFSLKSVKLPDNLEKICDGAFACCSSVKELVIPASVEEIKGNPFYGSTYSLICNSSAYIVEDNCLYNSSKTELKSCCKVEANIEIPNGVKYIGENAFCSMTWLQHIIIPNSVISIGKYAFYKCDNINPIKLPDSVLSIGDYAFEGSNFELQLLVSKYSYKRIKGLLPEDFDNIYVDSN